MNDFIILGFEHMYIYVCVLKMISFTSRNKP